MTPTRLFQQRFSPLTDVSARSLAALVVCVGLLLAGFPTHGIAALDEKRLQTLKATTAYIEVTAGKSKRSGSGFVIRSDGNVAILVTNSHVASLNPDAQTIAVYLGSGTRRERRFEARLIADNRADDLAYLRIEGTRLPKPLRLGEDAPVRETQPLYVVGFPFGSSLATNRKNPTVTISQGTVSSLKYDMNDDIFLVQVDGDINPGNSGGPIVRPDGELVGVTVAQVGQTSIGFAIPKSRVAAGLEGLMGNVEVAVKPRALVLTMDKLDPLDRIRSARLVVGDRVSQDDGRVLSAAKKPRPYHGEFRISRAGMRYTAEIPRRTDIDFDLYAQIELLTADGKLRQRPFRIFSDSLTARLEGPNVIGGVVNATLGDSGDTPEDYGRYKPGSLEAEIHAVLVKSGVEKWIRGQSRDPESLSEAADGDDDDQTLEFKQRLVEIMSRGWDPEAVKKHYVDEFRQDLDATHLNMVSFLLDSPKLAALHKTPDEIFAPDPNEISTYFNRYTEKNAGSASRDAAIATIDKARRITDAVAYAAAAGRGTVTRAINAVKPKSRRKPATALNTELSKEATLEYGKLARLTRAAMLYSYRNVDDRALSNYAKIVSSDAFGWYSDTVFAAYSGYLDSLMAGAESELHSLFKDVQRSRLDVSSAPQLEGLTDDEAVARLIETYGRGTVIELILKRRAGRISIVQDGVLIDHSGKPRADLISTQSVNADLRKLSVSVEKFAAALHEFVITKRAIQEKGADDTLPVDAWQSSRNKSRPGLQSKVSCDGDCADAE